MATGANEPPPELFLQSLCQHVCAPLESANQRLECEHTETTAERDAFESFTERLTTIDAVRATSVSSQATAVAGRSMTTDGMERVRTAYRETVMDVAHYNEVYGESLGENIAAEFGADLAAGVRVEASMPLTQPYKTALAAAAAQAVQKRRAFVEALNREAASIASARTALSDLLANLDTTTIPDWHREAFTEQLDRIAHERQATLRTHQSVSRFDGHSLCGYLYQAEPWTYPVLTAVTRLREAVVL